MARNRTHQTSPTIFRPVFIRGVATGWTRVDVHPTFAKVVPEIDTNPVSFYWGRGVGQVWSVTRQSLPYVNFNDNAAPDDAAGDDNTVLYLQFF